jgi:hypothetical protein
MADTIREAIAPFTTPDPSAISGRKDYTVRSIYFDRSRFRNYFEKKEGLRNRRKLRIRGYNEGDENSTVFLEIKRRRGLPVQKARAPIKLADVQALLATGNIERFIRSDIHMEKAYDDARSFLFHYHRYALRPTAKVIYEREAHFGRFDKSVRITLDLNLRSELFPRLESLFLEDHVRHVYRDHFIVEIKFTGTPMPIWARTLVERIEGKWRALSKYTLSLDSHNVPIHRLDSAVRSGVIQPIQTYTQPARQTNQDAV